MKVFGFLMLLIVVMVTANDLGTYIPGSGTNSLGSGGNGLKDIKCEQIRVYNKNTQQWDLITICK